jgi:hypothetical protein
MSCHQTHLAFFRGFGGVVKCSCGQYHIHLPGVSVRLNETDFDLLLKMIDEAKSNRELYGADNAGDKRDHLLLVKH